MTVMELFDRSRREFSHNEAVVCGALRLSYHELGERVDGLAAGLVRLGLGHGARVSILEKNCHRHLEAYLAAARSGSVLVPLNYRLAPTELTAILVESGARAIMVGSRFMQLLEAIRGDLPDLERAIVLDDEAPAGAFAYERLLAESLQAAPHVERNPNEPLVLYYTSGTTGRPKGVMVGDRNIVFDAESKASVMGLTFSDRYLHVLPMFHRGGTGVPTGTLLAGVCICLAECDRQRYLQLLHEEHIGDHPRPNADDAAEHQWPPALAAAGRHQPEAQDKHAVDKGVSTE